MPLLRLRIPVVLALLVATCYASVLATYGFADDFALLEAAVLRSPELKRQVIAGGRPIYALLLDVSFRWAGTLGRLALLRAVGVLGIALVAGLLHVQLVRRGWSRFEAACIALVVVSMPAFRLCAFWTVAAAFPYAALLGAASFLLAERAALSESGPRRAAGYGGAYLALVLALATYQPAAMFFWTMAAVATFSPAARAPFRLLVRAGLVFAAGALTALALLRLGSALFPVLPSSRTTLSLDLGAKLAWFARGALVDVLHYVLPGHAPGPAIAVGLLLVAGLAAYLAREGRLLSGLLLAAGLMLASYTPNLAASESWSAYRTQLALGSVAVVLAAAALRGYAKLLAGHHARSVTRGAFGVLAAGSLLVAATFTSSALVEPATAELRWLRAQLAPERVAGHERVRVVAAHWYDSIAPVIDYDEVGIPSLARAWSARGFAMSVLHDAGLGAVPLEVLEPEPEPAAAPACTLVVDGRTLRALR